MLTEASFLEGLVRPVFDSKHVIGKSYCVKANQNSVAGSVISSSAYLVIDKDNKIQNNPNYTPSKWMLKNLDDRLIILILVSFNDHNKIF